MFVLLYSGLWNVKWFESYEPYVYIMPTGLPWGFDVFSFSISIIEIFQKVFKKGN